MRFFIVLSLCLVGLTLCAGAGTSVYFSPSGGCTDAIVSQIDKAQSTIDIMMYSFTSRPIIQALEKAKERGVTIRVLLDKAQETQKYAKGRYLSQREIAVRYDTGQGLMHNKVGIIDGKLMFTGSFNWTAQAEKYNAENLLQIDDPALIKQYQARFELLWGNGRPGGSR